MQTNISIEFSAEATQGTSYKPGKLFQLKVSSKAIAAFDAIVLTDIITLDLMRK